jgi:hypothetical protein
MSESRLNAVPIFACGSHRGKVYTRRDLDNMAENFDLNRKRLKVPAVLGHDEEQVMLKGTGLPAAAWTDRVYRKGKILYADFADVPSSVMRLLRGRVYRKVSAEVYDDPPDGVQGKGKTLRRIAFLGGDIPQLKTLDDIPIPESHSENAYCYRTNIRLCNIVRMPEGAYSVFSEVESMNREEILKTLASMGMDVSSLTDVVPDQALMEILRVVDSLKEQAEDSSREESIDEKEQGDDETPPVDEEQSSNDTEGDMGQDEDRDDEMMADDEEMDKEEQSGEEEYEDWPEPKDDEEKEKYKEKARKYYEHAKKHYEKYWGKECDKMTEADMGALANRVVSIIRKDAKSELATLKKFAEEAHTQNKRSSVDAFIDANLKAGKILPAEIDEANPGNLRDRLYRADAKRVVAKFSENGKNIEFTELDLQMREIESRPAAKFSERFRASKAGVHQTEDQDEVKIKGHYELYSEQYKKLGVSCDSLVKGFAAQKKLVPTTTIDDYLNN